MKTAGIVGGIGPESTIDYYRFTIEDYRRRHPDGSYPALIINSVDLSRLIKWIEADELESFAEYLIAAVHTLARAGADFAALAANTPHVVFDRIQARVPIPLLSIVEAARDHARTLGLRRLGLLGTRFTMQGRFYPETFSRAGLTIITPNQAEQVLIHEKYFGELLKNIFLPETRDQLLAIINLLKARDGVDGVILAGTELPLLLRGAESALPFLDTTKIHVARIVEEMLR